MTNRLTFTIGSYPDEEDLVADLFYDDEGWGAITRRSDRYVLELFPKSEGTWSFVAEDALAVMTEAYDRLRSLERTDQPPP